MKSLSQEDKVMCHRLQNSISDVAKYGLLISNYPVDDPRNKIGFCGVKLFLPGKQVYLNNLSRTFSTSMYLDESEDENI